MVVNLYPIEHFFNFEFKEKIGERLQMIKILFIRSKTAFLPEIDAYIDFFNSFDQFQAFDSSKLVDFRLDDFDVLWEFKGVGGIKKNKNQVLVHEYASMSTGQFSKLKNHIKSKINQKPDIRVFLNEKVKSAFEFNDNIDYCLRDMGITEEFVSITNNNKIYDFVYIGSICKSREMDKFLDAFMSKENGKLCLVGNVEKSILKRYENCKNLIFLGKIPYSEIPKVASMAKYGVNFIPDKYPFNIQTSTKLLEYLALGLKIITTDYEWIRSFEYVHNCSFFKLDYYNLRFDKNMIEEHEFICCFNAQDFIWSKIIQNSGILDKITQKLGENLILVRRCKE